jgi:hypothetical protein
MTAQTSKNFSNKAGRPIALRLALSAIPSRDCRFFRSGVAVTLNMAPVVRPECGFPALASDSVLRGPFTDLDYFWLLAAFTDKKLRHSAFPFARA